MMGRSHIISHTAFAGILLNTGLVLQNYTGRLSEWVQPIGAVSLAWFASAATDIPYGLGYGLAVGLFLIGSLLPDIDSPNSLLGRYVHLPIGHRTWTHSVWFFLPLVVLAYFIPVLSYLGLGYGLHLLMDSVSRCGVAFFYPFSNYLTYPGGAMVKKNHRMKLYRTKHWTEATVVVLLVLVSIGFSYWMWRSGQYPF